MLTIDNPSFTATVTVSTAAIKGDFKCDFMALPTDELALLDNGEPLAWKAVLAKVVRGFEPVKVCGETIDGSQADALAKLLRWPGVGAAMLRAYYSGLWDNAAGN